ncbi:MAG: Uma2 family endonuclease [Bryobacteraceae bacterium]
MISVVEAPVRAQSDVPRRKLWTRDECARLATLFNLDRYELIEGELIEKVSKNYPHITGVLLLVEWLRLTFPSRNVVQEASIDVSAEDNPTSEPEPDAVVLRQSILELARRPSPEDVLLVAEVSVSTLAFDSGPKRDLYARAGIPEYWVLDIENRRTIVHRDPAGGEYRSVTSYGEDESVAPLAAPEAAFSFARVMAAAE